MHLVYFDESGNSGCNLDDPEQPIFVLGALIVPESCWQEVERDLEAELSIHFPAIAAAGEEVHGGDLRGSRGCFKGVLVHERIALRDAWLGIAIKHALKFVYWAIDKQHYKQWLQQFSRGKPLNPHIPAFILTAITINGHLARQDVLGMFISDENKEIVRDVETAIRQLRLMPNPLRLSQIIEKGFFIDSAKSRILQLCDMCVLHARKKEEVKSGIEAKPFDIEGMKLIEPIILHRGDGRVWDVLAQALQQQKQDK